MRTFCDAKAMAKTLRRELAERKLDLTHSECLELVAHQFGLTDWNTLAASIDRNAVRKPLRLPEGWIARGAAYDMGIDEKEPGAALIRSRYAAGDPAFGTKDCEAGLLMQCFLANGYRGKRISLRASLKTEEVDGAATIWMRVDRGMMDPLRFDNLESRPSEGALRGTEDWSGRRIVLDVPDNAESIFFGFYLRGTGCAWVRDFALAEVGDDTPVTADAKPEGFMPVNLDFSRYAAMAS